MCYGAGPYLFSMLDISWDSSIWKQSPWVLGTVLNEFIDGIFCSSSQIPLQCLHFGSSIFLSFLSSLFSFSFYFTSWDIFSTSFLNSFIELSLLLRFLFLNLGALSFLSSEWSFLIAPCSCSWVWHPTSLGMLRTASCCRYSCESFLSLEQSQFPPSCIFLLVVSVSVSHVRDC